MQSNKNSYAKLIIYDKIVESKQIVRQKFYYDLDFLK